MRYLTVAEKFQMTALVLGSKAIFIGAVLSLAWVTGISVVAALLIVAVVAIARNLAGIWISDGRQRGTSSPPLPSGDRFPRKPFPSTGSMGVEHPFPDSLA